MRRGLLLLLAAGCGLAPRTAVESAGPRTGTLELHFPLPPGSGCSRGFLPAERHFALDIPAPSGTPVRASGRGVVVRASSHLDYGLVVAVHHAGAGASVYTVYAHLSSISVTVGDEVAMGTKLGEVGRTGNATGPHLHWEVLRAPSPLPLRSEGPLGIPGDLYRVDPAEVATGVPPSCRRPRQFTLESAPDGSYLPTKNILPLFRVTIRPSLSIATGV